jgi:hypothetical protein
MYEREDDLTLYSQVNSMAAYINMIKFAMEKLELYVDEIGDEVFFRNESTFPEDVLGDDSLFAGYTDPWSSDDECQCDDCRCRNADAKINPDRMSIGNIMDILSKTRKAPQDYRMD